MCCGRVVVIVVAKLIHQRANPKKDPRMIPSAQTPTGNDKSKRAPFDFRKFIRRHAIVAVFGTLGVCWLVIRGIALQVNGPSSLSAKHYWADEKVCVHWKWRKTALTKTMNGANGTMCIASGKIQNLDRARLLNVRSITLLLMDKDGVDLDSEWKDFGGMSGVDLKPRESQEFTMKYWVPTGFLRDVRELSARIGCDFKTAEEKRREEAQRTNSPPSGPQPYVRFEGFKEIEYKLAAGYEDTIPPEILRRYEPAIVKHERPVIVRITQPMIFGLRDKPDQGGDVYTFDFYPTELSSVQQETIRKWVRDGRNVLFWGCNDAQGYADLFRDAITLSHRPLERCDLNKHPVNTDVQHIEFGHVSEYEDHTLPLLTRFGSIDGTLPQPRYFLPLLEREPYAFQTLLGKQHPGSGPWLYSLTKYPPDTEVIVSCTNGVVAGRVPYGRGNIYFQLHGSRYPGADWDRWTLNFNHWMLGFPVPGAVETTLGSSNRPEGKVAEPQDRIGGTNRR